MDIVLGLVKNVLEESFIYGIMIMGVYITYKILDFPDLSVDGTFPLGACSTAAPSAPIRRITSMIRSLAVTPGASVPSTVIRIVRSRR